MKRHRRRLSGSKSVILILLVITAAAVSITVWALFFRESRPELTPDYIPDDEENAEEIPGDSAETPETSGGGGSVSLTYSDRVTIDISNASAGLLFANPGKSDHAMVLQIVIQDEVIVQSGTIKPGRQVTSLDLLNGAANQLTTGGYDGKFVVLYYDITTGEKSVVNTEIPIAINVTE